MISVKRATLAEDPQEGRLENRLKGREQEGGVSSFSQLLHHVLGIVLMNCAKMCVLLESAKNFCEKCNGWGVTLLNNNNKKKE